MLCFSSMTIVCVRKHTSLEYEHPQNMHPILLDVKLTTPDVTGTKHFSKTG